MSTERIRVERDGEIAVLKIDRPPVNALDKALPAELAEAFRETIGREDVAAVVVTGTGECFSAGLDLKALPTYGPAELGAMMLAVNRMVLDLYGSPKPTVGAINGHAIAGGAVLALCLDYRVSAPAPAKLGLTEVSVGVPFPVGPRVVVDAGLDPATVRRLTLGGELIDPEEARACGLVDEVVPREEVLPRAVAKARQLAGHPPEVYARIKLGGRAEALARLVKSVTPEGEPLLAEGFIRPPAASP